VRDLSVRALHVVLATLPTFAVAATFLVTWIAPDALGANMLQDLLCLMMLEFVLMHASVMLGAMPLMAKTRAGKLRIVAGLAVAYSVFGVGLPLAWDALWLAGSFGALVVGKLVAVRHIPDEGRIKVQLVTWGCTIACFILFVAGAAVFPFPRLGIDAEYVRFPGGDKLDDPHRIVGAGFLYWGATAALQCLSPLQVGHRWSSSSSGIHVSESVNECQRRPEAERGQAWRAAPTTRINGEIRRGGRAKPGAAAAGRSQLGFVHRLSVTGS